MTNFKRTCKLFDKFLVLLKRHGMSHTEVITETGELKLTFWYIGTNYEEVGCIVWNNTDYGIKEALYEAYESAYSMLIKHDPKNLIAKW